MNLIKPSFEIISPLNGERMLERIELAARTCYQSEGKIEKIEVPYTDGIHQIVVGQYLQEATSARKLISKLIANGHEAMLEFGGNITVRFICDRGISHELVRHRMASFAQESTRYCNYGKNEHISFIIPSWIHELKHNCVYTFAKDIKLRHGRQILENDLAIFLPNDVNEWVNAMLTTEEAYLNLLDAENIFSEENNYTKYRSWSPQEARSVLPNSLKTEINISTNIREWRHIFKLRCAKTAHPQMRELMIPLLEYMKTLVPIIFDDITY